MINLIIALLGLANAALNPLRRFHAGVIARGMIAIFILILIGFLCNIWGAMGVNLFFFFATILGTGILLTRPEPIIALLGTGFVSGTAYQPQTIEQEIRRFLGSYVRATGIFLFYTSIAFFFLGTFPFGGNWKAFWVIFAGVVLLGFIQWVWNLGGDFGKRFVYRYTFAMIILAVFSLIDRNIYIEVFGFDVKGIFENRRTEKSLAELEAYQVELRDRQDDQRIQDILDRQQDGKEPTPEELQFLSRVRKERDEKTLPGRAKATYGKASEKLSKVKFPEINFKIPEIKLPDIKIPEKKTEIQTPKIARSSAPKCRLPLRQQAPAANTPEKWELTTKGITCPVKVKADESLLITFERINATFQGRKVGPYSYQGEWSRDMNRRGDFYLSSTDEGKTFSGWHRDYALKGEVSSLVVKKTI